MAGLECMTPIIFETFNVPTMCLVCSDVASGCAVGRHSSGIMDAGDGVSHTVPAGTDYNLPRAIIHLDFACRDLTGCLFWIREECNVIPTFPGARYCADGRQWKCLADLGICSNAECWANTLYDKFVGFEGARKYHDYRTERCGTSR